MYPSDIDVYFHSISWSLKFFPFYTVETDMFLNIDRKSQFDIDTHSLNTV